MNIQGELTTMLAAGIIIAERFCTALQLVVRKKRGRAMKKRRIERNGAVIGMLLLTYLSGIYALWHVFSGVIFSETIRWDDVTMLCIPVVVCSAALWLMAQRDNEALHDVWNTVSILMVCIGIAVAVVGCRLRVIQYEQQINSILYPSAGVLEEWEYWYEVNQCDLHVHELKVELIYDMLASVWNIAMTMIVPLVVCGMTADQTHRSITDRADPGSFARMCYAGAFLCGIVVILLYAFYDTGTLVSCGAAITLAFALLWCTTYTCGRYRFMDKNETRRTIIR